MLLGDALRERMDVCGRLRKVLRPVGRDDDHRERAVRFQAVVEQAQRLGDPAGVHVLLARERLVEHRRRRVAVGVLAERDCDVGEMLAAGAELVHVAAREHRDLVHGADDAEGAAPLPMTGDAPAHLGPGAAAFGGALAGPPRHGHVALTGGDRHRCVAHDAAARAAAVADLGEERDVTEAQVAGDVDLATVFHREHRHPVDLGGLHAGVVERGRDGLARERQLGVRQPLGERRLPDAGDRGPVGERPGHDYFAPSAGLRTATSP